MNKIAALALAGILAVSGPAFSQAAGTAGAPGEEVTVEALQDLADTMGEKITVLTGVELDAFAAAIEPVAGPKPAEIKTIVLPDVTGKAPSEAVSVAFFTDGGKFLYFGTFSVELINKGFGQDA